MTQEERLLANLRALMSAESQREIALLKRKLKKVEESRNVWKETALRYQKNLIERNK